MDFATYFSRQARKPSGLFGRFVMARIFDRGNAELNGFMKEQLNLAETDHVLEIGFGTGALTAEMAETVGRGSVEGVDFSDTMFSIASRRNRRHVRAGRVKLRLGRFEEMGFGNDAFDKVCTANTLYFWEDPEGTAKEIRRVLKPGGRLAIGFGDKAQLERKPLSREVFRFYSAADVKALLIDAGFSGGVDILTKRGRDFVLHCAVAVK